MYETLFFSTSFGRNCSESLFLPVAITAQTSSDAGGGATSGGATGASGSGGSIGMIVGENYVLKPSDVISVEVYQEKDLDKQARIEGDGTVTLPLVGKVKVANMTVAESQSLIQIFTPATIWWILKFPFWLFLSRPSSFGC